MNCHGRRNYVMKKRIDTTEYDTRFKLKLNMLDAGYIMMKIVFVLALVGVITCIVGYAAVGRVLFVTAGIILALLLILVRIELYQDSVLNELAERENNEQ